MFKSFSPARMSASKKGTGQFDLSSFNDTRHRGKSQTACSSFGVAQKAAVAINGFGGPSKK